MTAKNRARSTSLIDSLERERPSAGPPAEQRPQAAVLRTHDEVVERRLLAIAWFTGIVAAAVVANFIATVAIAAAASSASLY